MGRRCDLLAGGSLSTFAAVQAWEDHAKGVSLANVAVVFAALGLPPLLLAFRPTPWRMLGILFLGAGALIAAFFWLTHAEPPAGQGIERWGWVFALSVYVYLRAMHLFAART